MQDIMRPKESCWQTGLQRLIEQCIPQDAVVLEIGAFAGEGTEILLKSGKINRLYVVDAWDNSLDLTDLTTTQFDLSEVEKVFDARVKGYNTEVIKVKGNSLEVYSQFKDDYFDLVYHDAAHSYEHVITELGLYLPKVKPNGVISGHDYDAAYPGVTRAVNEFFGKLPDITFEDYSWANYL